MTKVFFPTSGSVYAADASIGPSLNKWTQIYLIADEGKTASANIQMGLVAASTMFLLKAASGLQSPTITMIPTGCLSINGLENGDVIALVRV